VNATTVSDSKTGERLFQSMAPGAGIGVRLGIYLALQETF
jgi:hypothetical protein